MKKELLLICMPLLTLSTIQAQKMDSATIISRKTLHDWYWQKRTDNKTAAWIFLVAGMGMTLGGLGSNVSDGLLSNNPNKGVGLTIAGLATSLVSIPFFIAAGTNKKRAALALKGETVRLGNKLLPNSYFTGVSLTLAL